MRESQEITIKSAEIAQKILKVAPNTHLMQLCQR